jgi:hypothetical protein
MKLAAKPIPRLVHVAALACFTAGGIASGVSCSSSTSGSPIPQIPGTPPNKPNAATTTSQDVRTYAVHDLHFGVSPADAWKTYGYNLDGKASVESSTDVCSGDKQARVDGNNGIDNAFGHIIASTIDSASPGFESTLNAAIARGAFTLMFDIKGLTGDAAQTNVGLAASVFAGGTFDPTLQTSPKFTTDEDWPVAPQLLVDGATVASGSKVVFADAYMSGGTFVGTAASLELALQLLGQPLSLKLHKATVTFKVDGTDGTAGVISGVLATDEFVESLRSVAPYISSQLCGGGFALLEGVIRQASDILSDGTNDATKMCSGISMGIGFTAKQIARPKRVDASPPTNVGDPCAPKQDGGIDGGADAH